MGNNKAAVTQASFPDWQTGAALSRGAFLNMMKIQPLDRVQCCVTNNTANTIKVVQDFKTNLSALADENRANYEREYQTSPQMMRASTQTGKRMKLICSSSLQPTLPPSISHVWCGVHPWMNEDKKCCCCNVRQNFVKLRLPKLPLGEKT